MRSRLYVISEECMNRDESLAALKHLLSLIEEENNKKQEYLSAQKCLKKATSSYATRLGAFDDAHKPRFIADKIGEKPVKPHGLIKFVVPVYLSKRKKYMEEIKFYYQEYAWAEAAYREKYKDERNALATQDKVEQAEAITRAQTNAETAKQKYDLAVQALVDDCTVNQKFKEVEIVQQLITFFEEGRVDSLKEAINLWYDEKRKDEEEERAEAHRQKLLELEEERVRAAQEAEEYARQAASDAREAAEMARKNYLQNCNNTVYSTYEQADIKD